MGWISDQISVSLRVYKPRCMSLFKSLLLLAPQLRNKEPIVYESSICILHFLIFDTISIVFIGDQKAPFDWTFVQMSFEFWEKLSVRLYWKKHKGIEYESQSEQYY